jgi:membrane protein insertase Oxa1/YidC/SpoIIIJ
MPPPSTPLHIKDFVVPEGTGTSDISIENILIQAGQISNDAFIPVSPETIAAHVWLMLEHDLGIPLWAAMALTTWGIRTAALPIFFAQVRNMAVLGLIAPKIQQIKHKMALQEQSGDEVMVKYWNERLAKLYKTFGASPWKNFASSLVIVPLMVAQAFSARYMLTYTPHLLEQSGPLWLSNLTAVDPLYITPCLYVGLQLLILRLNLPMQSGIIGNVKNVSKTSWALLACYSAALGFICTQFPAAISTLWLYSMSFTALSNAAMYFPWVRRKLDIATSLPVERPAHLPPKLENPVKAIVSKELTREFATQK